MLDEWNKLYNQFPQLAHLTIPLYMFENPEFVSIEIHGFADASIKAYGACIYFRTVCNDNTVKCILVVSKSRQAPMKSTTLARLLEEFFKFSNACSLSLASIFSQIPLSRFVG